MITSAHSITTNSLGFNSILQTFYEKILEVIVSKMVSRIFSIFSRSSFINNFMAKNNFSVSKNHQKISRPICFLKSSAHRFEGKVQEPWRCFHPVLYKSFDLKVEVPANAEPIFLCQLGYLRGSLWFWPTQ